MQSKVRPIGLARLLLAGAAAAAAAGGSMPAGAGERLTLPRPGPRGPVGLQDRVGTPIRADLSPARHGRWREAEGGGQTWTLRVTSPGAEWLGLGFERLDLPDGARLTVTDAAGRPVTTFTSHDARPRGERWAPPVAGQEAVIELTWPEPLRGRRPGFVLGTVTHGDVPLGGLAALAAPSGTTDCNTDVLCSPEGDAWRAERRGVVQMVIMSNGAACTGSLINNTANLATTNPPFDDVYPAGMRCAPYVLTAEHCFATSPQGAGTAESTVFLFNYEVDPTGDCAGGLAPGIAPRSQTLTGATTVALFGSSDFRLLLLDELPPREFGARLNGWNRATAAATATATIHHPADLAASVPEVFPKKITVDSDPPVSGLTFGANHWRVVDWDAGSTEPGSSGAPLFDQNRRIVGQLHGGDLVGGCGATSNDEFGKLSSSWTGGGSSGSRLSSHLDPIATGVTTLDGIELETCLDRQPGVVPVAHVVEDDTPLGNRDSVADPGDVLHLAIDLFNGRARPTTAVSATISSPSALVTVLDPHASWANLGPLASGTSVYPHVGLELDDALVCGASPQIDLTVTAAEGSWQSSFLLETGTPGQTFFDDGDSGTDGFFCEPGLCVAGDDWSVAMLWGHACEPSVCPDASWFIADDDTNTNAVIVTPEIRTGNLPARSTLTFRHRMRSEKGFDGGVLEYFFAPTTGGGVWIDAYDLIREGFYDATIDESAISVIAGRPAWSGMFDGWRTVTVDLEPFALQSGMRLLLRWRFVTDSGGSVDDGGGWWVDDVEIRGGNFTCNAPASRHYPGSVCNQDDRSGRDSPCVRRDPPRGGGPSRAR